MEREPLQQTDNVPCAFPRLGFVLGVNILQVKTDVLLRDRIYLSELWRPAEANRTILVLK